MIAEATIEAELRDACKEMGGRCYKWVSPGNNGVPDRIVILPGRVPIFAELKTARGVLSKTQKLQINRLLAAGQRVEVIQGEDQLIEFLRSLGAQGRIIADKLYKRHALPDGRLER